MKSLPEHAGVRAILSEKFPNAVASFEEKLVRAGYLDAYADFYGAMRTTLHEIHGFRVTEALSRPLSLRPRIRSMKGSLQRTA